MSEASPADRPGPRAIRALFLLVVGVLFTFAVVVLIERNAHFYADDFSAFYMARTRPFLEYVFTPSDIHVFPLHRVLSYAIYSLFPLDFRAALLVLLSFHVAALAYLYRTLQALKDTPLNQVLVLLYAANVYLFVPLMWWSSGALRFPYVFFAVGSLYHYVRFRQSSSTGQLVVVALFFALALGFYAKGFLIPAYLLGIEICLLRETPRPQLFRNLGVVGALALVGALYYHMGRAGVDTYHSRLHLDWRFLMNFEKLGLSLLGQGLLTFVYRSHRTMTNFTIGSIWALVCLYTVVKRPRNLLVWCVGLGLVGLNILSIAISPRASRFDLLLVRAYRYYFELTFLVVVFLGLALHNLPPHPFPAAFNRLRHSGMITALAALLIVAYALSSYSHAKELLGWRYPTRPQVRKYVENLRTSVENLRLEPPGELALVDGLVPRHVMPFTGGGVRRYSDFLEIFGVQVSPGAHGAPLYRISEEGRLERVQEGKAAGGIELPSEAGVPSLPGHIRR